MRDLKPVKPVPVARKPCVLLWLLTAVLVSSCNAQRIRTLELTVDRLEGELRDADERLAAARENLDDGAEAVAEGMTGLVRMEPFDAAPYYEASASLRDYTARLLAEIERRSFMAGIVGVELDEDLAIRVTSYSGTLRLDLWIDDRRDTPIVRYALQGVGDDPLEILGLSGRIAEEQLEAWAEEANPEGKEGSFIAIAYQPLPPCYRDVPCLPQVYTSAVSRDHRKIDEAYTREIREKLGRFLREPFASFPAERPLDLPLDNRLWTPGRHTLFVGLVPEAADANGRWHVGLELVDAGGQTLLKWRIDSGDLHYDWSPGEAMAPIRLGDVVVRVDQ